MKPTKNRYHCVDAWRPKMLFATEKKANRFMEFNSLKILELSGIAPIRSYYCSSCGGWHVTSSEKRYENYFHEQNNSYAVNAS